MSASEVGISGMTVKTHMQIRQQYAMALKLSTEGKADINIFVARLDRFIRDRLLHEVVLDPG